MVLVNKCQSANVSPFDLSEKEELDEVMTQHGEDNITSESCGNSVLSFLLLAT